MQYRMNERRWLYTYKQELGPAPDDPKDERRQLHLTPVYAFLCCLSLANRRGVRRAGRTSTPMIDDDDDSDTMVPKNSQLLKR